MKVTRNTTEHLIVGQNPIWVAVILVIMALIFLGIGMGMLFAGEWIGLAFACGSLLPFGFLYIFVRRVQLIFSKAEGTLTIQRKNMRNGTTVIHQLSEVERAELESSRSENNTLYRVTLILNGQSAGRHPITSAYSNIGNHKAVTEAINTWLDTYRKASPTPSLDTVPSQA